MIKQNSAMYKAVFFDVDDTLLDFRLCSQAALSETFNDYNLPYSSLIYDLFYRIDSDLWKRQKQGSLSVQEVVNLRFKKLFASLNTDIDTNEFQSSFQENLSKEHILEPDAIETVQHVSLQYQLYVASNGFLKMQQSRLKRAGLLPYFSDLFVSDDIGYEKPNRMFFSECLERSKLKREDILFVGDSLEADITGAYHSGIATCWYNPQHKANTTELNIGYIIESLSQLRNILI